MSKVLLCAGGPSSSDTCTCLHLPARMRAPQISWLALLVCALLLVEQCAAKQAPKVRAQRRHREWMSKQHAQQAIRRSLLQDDSAAGAPAPAPAGAPLELPSDAMNVCSYEKLRKATKCSNNKKVFYEVW